LTTLGRRHLHLAAARDRIDRLRFSLDREELLPDLGFEQNRSCLAAFAEDGDLAAFLARQDISPLQPADLADANAREVKRLQQNPIAALRAASIMTGPPPPPSVLPFSKHSFRGPGSQGLFAFLTAGGVVYELKVGGPATQL
jgi:hypothetical protein